MQEIQPFLHRFRYMFLVGDKVVFHPDMEDFNSFTKEKTYQRFAIKYFRTKVGTVIKCWSDLHGFAQGSAYMCAVDFDGVIVTQMAGAFEKNECNIF